MHEPVPVEQAQQSSNFTCPPHALASREGSMLVESLVKRHSSLRRVAGEYSAIRALRYSIRKHKARLAQRANSLKPFAYVIVKRRAIAERDIGTISRSSIRHVPTVPRGPTSQGVIHRPSVEVPFRRQRIGAGGPW